MTNRTPRYDGDSDDSIENSAVDALANLAAGDTFSGYPLGNSDLANPAVDLGHEYFQCYEDGGTYYVKNMRTGSIDSSGSDPDVQLQYAFDNLPAESARSVIDVRGDWTGMSATVTTTQTEFTVDAYGAYFQINANTPILDVSTDDVRVHGGTWDGSNQADTATGIGVVDTSGVNDCRFRDMTVQNGGDYGWDIYETNDSIFINCDANTNAAHGFHPGTDTAGRNRNNVFFACTANGNSDYGFNDRHGTNDRCGNKYIGCNAHNNATNGFNVFNDGTNASSNFSTTLSQCVATGNDKNFVLEDGDHRAFGCLSDGAVTSGIEVNDRGSPASPRFTVELHGCKAIDASTTSLGWTDVNLEVHGGRYGSIFQGSSLGYAKFNDVKGVTAGDASASIWVNRHAAAALGGAAPDATNYEAGIKVQDTDNAGDVYYVYDGSTAGGVTQIGT